MSNDTNDTATNTVHLQGIRKYPAKPIGEFNVGDHVVYNHGSLGEVVAIRVVGLWAEYTVKEEGDGKEYPRRRKATTLVPCLECGRGSDGEKKRQGILSMQRAASVYWQKKGLLSMQERLAANKKDEPSK